MRLSLWRWLVPLALFWLAVGSARAEPPQTTPPADDPAFARSALLELPSTIVAGEPFSASFRIRNDGPTTDYSRAVFTLPTDLLLAQPPPAGCQALLDVERRELVVAGPFAQGFDLTCRVQLIARPDASSHATFRLLIQTPPMGIASFSAGRAVVAAKAEGVALAGGLQLTKAGVVVLALLLGGPLLLGLVRGLGRHSAGGGPRGGRLGAALGLLIGITMVGLLLAMAWEDWRTLYLYRATQCDIVDGYLYHARSGSGSTRTNSTSSRVVPLFSLNYTLDGARQQALGFASASHFSETLSAGQAQLTRYPPGERRECWVDPADPRRVLLVRGFGGAYLFAPLPLIWTLVAFWWWWPSPRRGGYGRL